MRNVIIDFTIAFEYLDPADQKQALASDNDPSSGMLPWTFGDDFYDSDELVGKPDIEVEQGLVDAVAFLYRSAESAGVSPEALVEFSVKKAIEHDRSETIVSAKLDVEQYDIQRSARSARQKIEAGEPPSELTDHELRAILIQGSVPDDVDLGAYLRGE